MKNLKNILGLLFLALGMTGQSLHGAQAQTKSVDASVKRVDKEMSLLGQIVEQVDIIVDGTDQEARIQARKELKELMKSKDLDETVKNAIKDDIRIIKSPTTKTKRAFHEARIRLLNTYAKIDSQANVVEAIAHATKMVENASPEELDAVIVEAKKMVEAAEEEQGFSARMYAKAKRMVTAPVNYVFGEESSTAKTAFYAAVGLAVFAAGAYAIHQYKFDFMNEVPQEFRAEINELREKEKECFLLEQQVVAMINNPGKTPDERAEYDAIFEQLNNVSMERNKLKDDLMFNRGLSYDFVNKIRKAVVAEQKDFLPNPEIKKAVEEPKVFDDEFVQGLSFIVPNNKERVKNAFIMEFDGLLGVNLWHDDAKRTNRHLITKIENDVKILEDRLGVFMSSEEIQAIKDKVKQLRSSE